MTITATESVHILAEYHGCDRATLADPRRLESLLTAAADAAGAIVVEQASRCGPRGVTSVVLLGDSHLSVDTVPAKGYAAADLFTRAECDPHAAHRVLVECLRAERSELDRIDRGLPAPQGLRVRGHRALTRVILDCRAPKLPPGIRVGHSPGRGKGVFATRAFAPGERIFKAHYWLASFDTVFQILTDIGETVLSADDLGVELTIAAVEEFPDSVRAEFAALFGLEDPTPIELRERMTDGRRYEVEVAALDGLLNHSETPNITYDDDSIVVSLEDGRPVWTSWLKAIRPIEVGDELFWDYREVDGYTPPKDLKP